MKVSEAFCFFLTLCNERVPEHRKVPLDRGKSGAAGPMRKSPARKNFAIVVLLAAGLSGLSAYAQKPDPKRGVQDIAAPAPQANLPVGSYHALIIGINNYQSMPKLQTAVNDASALAGLLQEQYGFADTKLLRNATRDQILLALNAFKHSLPDGSNFLIYYAGHGYKDPATKIAYWLPVDAQSDNDVNWIGASAITDEIKGLHSSHVLVISDSCYSGDLAGDRGVEIRPGERDIYLRRMLESPSRTLMASGSDEPVADRGREGHSVFAYALLQSLRTSIEDGFTAADLFHKYIQQEVAGTSDQVPQYSVIKNSGHEFGDFVFSRGGKVVTVGVSGGGRDAGAAGAADGGGGSSVASPEADRYSINQLVNAYADSFNRKDAGGLWGIWPSASQSTKKAFQNGFSNALSIFMKVSDRDIELAGTHATVTGQFTQEYTPKNGNLQKTNGPIILEFEKSNGSWVITSVK